VSCQAWGVRTITFVDASRVSFSNPVRQPLFEFEDCLDGGKPKAACAAERLKKIFPGVVRAPLVSRDARSLTRQNATGYQLSVPMPGHPIPPASVAQAQKDVEQLEVLFDTHDAVFLLMDSRESRWLPTVLGAAKGKVRPGLARWISRLDDTAPDRVERGIGVRYVPRHATRCARRCRCGAPQRPAFGLLLLQRHRRACGRACLALFVFPVSFMPHSPSRTARSTKCAPSPDRGSRRSRRRPPSSSSCRSCNTQTGKPRPTSPRPAPSHSIHASLHAPPPPPQSHSSDAHDASGSVLGLVPHQLRGFLAQFRTLLVTGAAYDRRTGCSETVLRAYEGGGFGMLLRAFNEGGYLERLTGLDVLYAEGEGAMESVHWDEEEE
jgi:ubiquitin-like modifier-activating enzyme ATG7